MAQGNFESSLKFVLIDEGGNDDDPSDSGGRTSRGITQREYNAWCHIHNSPSGDVWHATDDTIKAIYLQQYWLPYCEGMPKGLDYLYFDSSVLSGAMQATRFLQRALGFTGSDVDGHLGVITAAAVLKVTDIPAFIQRFSDIHRQFYKIIEQEHPQDVKFDRGWLNRVMHAQRNAVSML